MRLLQEHAVSSDHCPVKGKTWFRAIPIGELFDRVIIRSTGIERCKTIQYGRLRLFKIRQFEDGPRTAFSSILRHSMRPPTPHRSACRRSGLVYTTALARQTLQLRDGARTGDYA